MGFITWMPEIQMQPVTNIYISLQMKVEILLQASVSAGFLNISLEEGNKLVSFLYFKYTANNATMIF
jgi:hypothetical protein